MASVSQSPSLSFSPPPPDAVSNGAFQGDNPLHFSFSVLVLQISLVLLVTRSLTLLFKPFRQPRVLAEIIGGLLLGPSALGRSRAYLNAVFPEDSLNLLDTFATFGLVFYLFIVGLELDLAQIRKSGKISVLVALAGIIVPFFGAIGVAVLLRNMVLSGSNLISLAIFLGIPMSITAFPVLVRIMAERKLLETDLGQMILPAAAINDVCGWILLALGLLTSGPSKSPGVPAYVLLCGAAYVLFMLIFAKRVLQSIANRAMCGETVNEMYVCLTLVGVLISGFITDVIGIHPFFGAFVFGLIVPKDGMFAQKLVEKIEDFVTVLMLPLFFASSGLKTNLGSINSVASFGFLILIILVASVGKISATVMVGFSGGVPLRSSFAMGFLMNTKGLVELIALNIGKSRKVFDDQTFAILVLMCLVMTFLTTPTVSALYKPARIGVPHTDGKDLIDRNDTQLRILACLDCTKSIPAVRNLLEALGGSKKRSLMLFGVYLMELSDRPSTIMSLSRAKKNGRELSSDSDSIFVAFDAFRRVANVPEPLTSAISVLEDMHDNICSKAAETCATTILLPVSFSQREDGTTERLNSEFRTVIQKVLQHASCSVGILVDRFGLWGSVQLSEISSPIKVAVFFVGGPDDRAALAHGCQLADHSNVRLWVLRLASRQSDHVINLDGAKSLLSQAAAKVSASRPSLTEGCEPAIEYERSRDEESLAVVQTFAGERNTDNGLNQSIFYQEYTYVNLIEAVIGIVSEKDFSLVFAGRRRCSSTATNVALDKHSEISELGRIGDALAASDIKASFMILQQQDEKLYGQTSFQSKSAQDCLAAQKHIFVDDAMRH